MFHHDNKSFYKKKTSCRHFIAALWACGLLIICHQPALAAEDYSGVGYVKGENSTGGTASLVLGRNIILTAAHIFYAHGQLRDSSFFYYPDGLYGAFCKITHIIAGSKQPEATSADQDWAAAKLDCTLPANYQPFMQFLNSNLGNTPQPAMLVSYHQANQQHVGSQKMLYECDVHGETSQLFTKTLPIIHHDCPSGGGASGAPLIIERYGKAYILGIHSGRTTNGRGIASMITTDIWQEIQRLQ
ncbi:MAG: trypsin-like serine peptidase [Alphaproteobacteria bacterium]